MPRPPSDTPTAPRPLWVTGGERRNAPNFRRFAIPIPAVPEETRQAIQNAVQQTQDNLTHRLAQEQQRIVAARERLQALEEQRATSLEDIRAQRTEEAETKLAKREAKLRREYKRKREERQAEWRKSIEEEVEAEWKKRKEAEKEEEDPSEEAPAVEEAPSEPVNKISDAKKEELESAKSKVESLTEQRSEMTWLLKNVIKAEAKRRLKEQAK